jgi:hypothetical protein
LDLLSLIFELKAEYAGVDKFAHVKLMRLERVLQQPQLALRAEASGFGFCAKKNVGA